MKTRVSKANVSAMEIEPSVLYCQPGMLIVMWIVDIPTQDTFRW